MPGTHTPGGSAGLTLRMTFGRAVVAATLVFVLGVSTETPMAHAQDVKAKAARGKAAPAKQQEDSEEAGDAAKATPKKRDPAEAQRQIDNGIKLLQGGKAEQAIQTITSAIAGGNLPAPVMAKALYQRGIAYRRTQKPAQAISDFTSALWLKNGLPEQERADALEQRNAAYRDAGLPDQGTTAARPQGGGSAAAASSAGSTDAQPARNQPIARAASAVVGSPASAAGRAAPQQPAAAASWTSTTEVKPRSGIQPAAAPAPAAQAAAAPKQAAATATAATAPAAQPARASAPARQGGFGARVALVRTKPEADAVVVRLKREFAAALEAREPEVSQVSFGNMGAFFQVRVAPFQSQEAAQAACGRLRGPGLDCVAVAR